MSVCSFAIIFIGLNVHCAYWFSPCRANHPVHKCAYNDNRENEITKALDWERFAGIVPSIMTLLTDAIWCTRSERQAWPRIRKHIMLNSGRRIVRKDKLGSRRITWGYWTLFEVMNLSDLHTPIRDMLCTLLTLFDGCRYINDAKPIRNISDIFTVTETCIVTFV